MNKKAIQEQLSQIQQHEQQIKASQHQDLNPIADLTEKLVQAEEQHQPAPVIHALIYALHRIFSSLVRQGRIHGTLSSSSSSSSSSSGKHAEAVKVVRDWLKEQYALFIDCLLARLRRPAEEDDDASGAQTELDCLTILMSLVRSESEVIRSLKASSQLGTDGSHTERKYPAAGFESSTFLKLVKALLLPPADHPPIPISVRAEFILRYLNFCDDIRFRFLKDATFLCQAYNPESNQAGRKKKKAKAATAKEVSEGQIKGLTRNLLAYLEALTTMPTRVDELNQFWTGKPQDVCPAASAKRKSRGASGEAQSRKKPKIASDGSTGIFDDPSSSESSELEEDAPGEGSKSAPARHPLLSLRAHQKAFSECWISLLSLQSLAEPEIKRVLNIMHHQLIPHMPDPTILMDFLVDCLDYGGTISVLSLNALFTLMAKHNLDYPDFYTRLYGLLDASVMHTRHRARFFRMLEVFLSSTHLPVNIVASFIKKIARLSLFAPPGAIITVVPFCYNLIKTHPTAMAMLHRVPSGDAGSLKALEDSDPFKPDEPDPLKTDAIFSSAWEFVGLRSHYLASIATLFKVFQEAFDKPKYDLEDFLDHTYSSLIDTELSRTVKKPPALSLWALAYKEPLLAPRASESSTPKNKAVVVDDIVSQIWKI
ncbi:hypothetical protein PCANC_05280 [Puccinia coronata f. sp. avenae]|uniref:CCAAT-binding factor domain-containing protein n=1 Tax=Puccinia coronata f. sp. avenae TaxID=200324 RepID=A0A2N5VYP1_9BASI|nr:hypothetical protein PCANC_05280 [Puccinia coronata f. sp. avenae]